jgi:hypothetical protein
LNGRGRSDGLVHFTVQAGMKLQIIIAILVLSSAAAGQLPQQADGTYARNGKMIGLTNLSPLSDCSVKSFRGKVRSVDVSETSAKFKMRSGKENMEFALDLSRLSAVDRDHVFKDLIKKGYFLRVNGYTCDSGPPKTISIERSY